MPWITLFTILCSLILIGFFAGIETAFISANKFFIELKKKQGTLSGKTWGQYSEDSAQFIGTTLIGFNIMLVLYGLLSSSIMSPFWDLSFWKRFNTNNPYLRLVVETGVTTFVLLFFVIFFKAIFKAKNERILNSVAIAYLINFFHGTFSGIANLFVQMSDWILKYIFNVKLHSKNEVFSKINLEHFMQQIKSHDIEDSAEINKELFENALSLSDIKIRKCLIPRKEIEGVEMNTDIETVKNKFISTSLSKLVVYDTNIDSIIGYVHQLDLFKNPAEIKDIILKIPTIPESMNVTDLMNKFSEERKSIAWVIDEFGGTAGIVTMEDLLEEIFGDIKDEYDTEEFIDKQLATNEFIFSGRLELDFISEKYKLNFPDSNETETLSGFIIKNRNEIPKQKEMFTIGNFQFDILNISDTRIETVKLKLLK